MQSSLALPRAPYGLAFAIEDLILARHWAEERRLRLRVALDSTVDGMEFEELLVFSPRHGQRRTLSVWRTAEGVFGQVPGCYPESFASLANLLGQLRPTRPRPSWRQRLGLA